MTYIFLYQ